MSQSEIYLKSTDEKLYRLREILCGMRHVVVAYSGGVDSTFLLKIAKEVLANNVLAIGSVSKIHHPLEIKTAQNFTKTLGVKYIPIITDELFDENFIKNFPDRCYYCKSHLFSLISKIAKREGGEYIVDGIHCDDLCRLRWGIIAAKEYGIRSPLVEAKMCKADIRYLSKKLNLSTWDMPARGCLALRFPYGMPIVVNEDATSIS